MHGSKILVFGLALIAALGVGLTSASADDGAVAADFVADFERASDKLVQLAEAIPADKYSWRPTDEVRKTSEVFIHVVGTNLMIPAALGAPLPVGMEKPENPFALMQEWEAKVTSKDEVIEKLKSSINYAAKAIPQLEGHDEEVNIFGFPASKRAYMLIMLTHVHEHLGQAIAYARSMGVVPPWSAAASEGAASEDSEGGSEAEAGGDSNGDGVSDG